MAFRQTSNVFSVILSDVTKLTSALPAVGDVVTSANLEKGAVVITNVGLERLDAAVFAALSATDRFLVVQGKGANQPLMKSPVLTKGRIAVTTAKFKPAQQQVTAIGFNGTTGALPTANNTDFWIKIRKRDNDAANRSQPMSLFAGPVKTDGTGTQAELAAALVKNGYLNFKDEPANHYLKFEAICNNAGATDGTATSATVVKGSKGVVLNAGPTTMAVGDFIRFGTAVSDPVYLIKAISGTNLTLDTPYVGETGAVAAIEFVTAALAAVANFGILITGIQAPFNVNSFRDYYANRFTANFSDSTVLVSHLAGAYNGNGMFQQVALDEYMSYGFEGQNGMLDVPPQFRDQEVKIPGVTAGATALTAKYSAINIAWEEDIQGLVSKAGGKGNVLVYLNLENSGGSGILATTPDNTGETLADTLGITPSTLNQ